MADPATDSRTDEPLREHAESRLRDGTAPRGTDTTLSADALGVLYRLASSPDGAADALKLLHELQTHQVELDLQQEQLLANEREIAAHLAHYKALFDFAPAGYLIADLNGKIIRSNQAAAELLGVPPDELYHRPIERFLAPESRPALANLLARLRDGTANAACAVTSRVMRPGTMDTRRMDLAARISPDGTDLLVMVAECHSPTGT